MEFLTSQPPAKKRSRASREAPAVDQALGFYTKSAESKDAPPSHRGNLHITVSSCSLSDRESSQWSRGWVIRLHDQTLGYEVRCDPTPNDGSADRASAEPTRRSSARHAAKTSAQKESAPSDSSGQEVPIVPFFVGKCLKSADGDTKAFVVGLAPKSDSTTRGGIVAHTDDNKSADGQQNLTSSADGTGDKSQMQNADALGAKAQQDREWCFPKRYRICRLVDAATNSKDDIEDNQDADAPFSWDDYEENLALSDQPEPQPQQKVLVPGPEEVIELPCTEWLVDEKRGWSARVLAEFRRPGQGKGVTLSRVRPLSDVFCRDL